MAHRTRSDPRPPGRRRSVAVSGTPRPGPAVLDLTKPLTEALTALFEATIARACAAADQAPMDPVTGVHEFRKAVRRAEAVIGLARSALSADAHRDLRRGLARALQGTSRLRDTDVELQTIAGIDLGPEHQPTLDLLLALVVKERDTLREEVKAAKLLASRKADLEQLPERMREGLGVQVVWADLEEGLGTTYRAARRALKAACVKPSDRRVHAFRLKAKPLRYQLEVLGDSWRVPAGELRQSMVEVTQRLGEIADLIALRKGLKARRRELVGGRPRRTRRALGQLVRARSREVLASAEALLTGKTRRFAHSVVGPVSELGSPSSV